MCETQSHEVFVDTGKFARVKHIWRLSQNYPPSLWPQSLQSALQNECHMVNCIT